MSARESSWRAPVLLTVVLVGLVVAAAFETDDTLLAGVWLASLGGAVVFLQVVFPGSRFFTLALANGLAVYVCIYVVFLRTNFPSASQGAMKLGFVLPILAFLAGAWLRRLRIRAIVSETRMGDRQAMTRGASWLMPVFGIGLLTFAAPNVAADHADLVFVGAMAAIAAVVFAVSADVATFLVEAGLLFDEFFKRVRSLAAPAFAFMTFYSVIVIVFASVYRLMDRLDGAHHFLIAGVPRELSFPESLYFSIVTMGTVGYGDIVPASDAARMIAGLQVVFGVLLLLFGFSELISYTRERRGRRED